MFLREKFGGYPLATSESGVSKILYPLVRGRFLLVSLSAS